MTVLEKVNMNIETNTVTAVFGDSGSGKTTLLKILSLLFREEPQYEVIGEIVFNSFGVETDILKLKKDLWKIRRKIVYLSQVPNPLHMSILKNVEFPLILQGVKDKAVLSEKAVSALKAVNLYDEVKERLDSSALGLSGGQRQKLCIARALTLEPEILLMDEPTSSLDTTNKGLIEDLIIELGKRYTIIVVSHDKDQIRKVAEVFFECKDKNINLSEF
jgi:phosphate transport system ATP-binding protein